MRCLGHGRSRVSGIIPHEDVAKSREAEAHTPVRVSPNPSSFFWLKHVPLLLFAWSPPIHSTGFNITSSEKLSDAPTPRALSPAGSTYKSAVLQGLSPQRGARCAYSWHSASSPTALITVTTFLNGRTTEV